MPEVTVSAQLKLLTWVHLSSCLGAPADVRSLQHAPVGFQSSSYCEPGLPVVGFQLPVQPLAKRRA